MIPFYILDLSDSDFTPDIDMYSVKYTQRKINSTSNTIISEPDTYIKKSKEQNLKGYIRYDVKVEKLKKQTIRIFDDETIYDEYIIINDDYAYYSKENNILIFQTSKDRFNAITREFEKHQVFKFNKIDISFLDIIGNHKTSEVRSIWLKGIQSDIRISSVSINGTQVEQSEHYRDLINDGAEISNLSINYEFNSKLIRTMITSNGGIIFYKKMDLIDNLTMINHIYTNLLSNK